MHLTFAFVSCHHWDQGSLSFLAPSWLAAGKCNSLSTKGLVPSSVFGTFESNEQYKCYEYILWHFGQVKFKSDELKWVMRCKAAISDITWTMASTPQHFCNCTASMSNNYLEITPHDKQKYSS